MNNSQGATNLPENAVRDPGDTKQGFVAHEVRFIIQDGEGQAGIPGWAGWRRDSAIE